MADDTSDRGEFSIGRGRDKDAGTANSQKYGASRTPPGKGEARHAEFDLGADQRQSESGMPAQLRRKYYVAEAGAGDVAKVYADPRGEYLAFKVSAKRMATQLEDAGVVRDIVSIAQHRGWKEVEVRGSAEFRRTAWLEASVRGLAVRGYEPGPVDRAALSFRTKADVGSTRDRSPLPNREPEASETIVVAGVSTKRPIDVTIMPPERSAVPNNPPAPDPAPVRNSVGSDLTSSYARPHAANHPIDRSAITNDLAPLRAEAPDRSSSTTGQRRAEMFRSADHRQNGGDDVVRASRSQLAAIERALIKVVRDPTLRRSVLDHAKERIAEHLERGREFKHIEVTALAPPQRSSKVMSADPKRQNRAKIPETYPDR